MPLMLLASIEGVWKIDLPYTQEKNPNSNSYRAFSSTVLEFKDAKIYQNKNLIANYKVEGKKIFESQDAKTWERSSLQIKKNYLTLNLGSSLIYFQKFNPDIESKYSIEMDVDIFDKNDFYKEGMHRYFDEEKILWKKAQLYATFKNAQEIHYRVYKNISHSTMQTDTYIYHFKETSQSAFSYRKFGISQNDWIDMDWYSYDHNKKHFADKDKEISFSPLFGDMDLFHVLGKEEVITPAGTFICTKVKGIEKPWSDPTIIWMIDDMPGVYAKVINLKEKKLYLLDKIKEK